VLVLCRASGVPYLADVRALAQAVDSVQASLDGLVQLSKLAWGTADPNCPAARAAAPAAAAAAPSPVTASRANGPAAQNGSSASHPQPNSEAATSAAAGAPGGPAVGASARVYHGPGNGASGGRTGAPGAALKAGLPGSPNLGWGGRRPLNDEGVGADAGRERVCGAAERESREAECEKVRQRSLTCRACGDLNSCCACMCAFALMRAGRCAG